MHDSFALSYIRLKENGRSLWIQSYRQKRSEHLCFPLQQLLRILFDGYGMQVDNGVKQRCAVGSFILKLDPLA